MSPRIWIVLGALSAAVAVGLGAYHAHGLEKMLAARNLEPVELSRRMGDFDVGVRYQALHAIGLILLGVVALQGGSACLNAAGFLFIAGTLLFSGGILVPVLTAVKFPWFIVPAGGLAFIAGWISFAVGAAWKR